MELYDRLSRMSYSQVTLFKVVRSNGNLTPWRCEISYSDNGCQLSRLLTCRQQLIAKSRIINWWLSITHWSGRGTWSSSGIAGQVIWRFQVRMPALCRHVISLGEEFTHRTFTGYVHDSLARAQPRSKSWGVPNKFFRPREGEQREGA